MSCAVSDVGRRSSKLLLLCTVGDPDSLSDAVRGSFDYEQKIELWDAPERAAALRGWLRSTGRCVASAACGDLSNIAARCAGFTRADLREVMQLSVSAATAAAEGCEAVGCTIEPKHLEIAVETVQKRSAAGAWRGVPGIVLTVWQGAAQAKLQFRACSGTTSGVCKLPKTRFWTQSNCHCSIQSCLQLGASSGRA